MEIHETNLRDVWLLKPEVFTDFRGDYVMTWNENGYYRFGHHFIEHDISTSKKGVLRGIHYSPDCWKLYQCFYGEMFYNIVNCDESDIEFGKSETFLITDKNHYQLLKHPRYGAGFYALTDCVLHYMQTEYYDSTNPNQKTFMWNDPRFNLWWPTHTPILSKRDEQGKYESEPKG